MRFWLSAPRILGMRMGASVAAGELKRRHTRFPIAVPISINNQ
jgi:hypothetical protein